MDQDLERAVRLRNNKRMHRQRQKEYVADLEQRLTESREKGIAATREVQLAARQVIWENGRLRQILGDQGLDDNAINSLVYNGHNGFQISPMAPPPSEPISKPRIQVQGIFKGHIYSTNTPDSESIPLISSNDTGTKVQPEAICRKMPDTTNTFESIKHKTHFPSCKLLSILANNPSADITGEAAAQDQNNSTNPASTECNKARELLMRFATTEEKLDSIAVALEKGCVRDGSGSGCRVQNDILWKTLDRVLE